MKVSNKVELVWCKLANDIGTLYINVSIPRKNCNDTNNKTNIKENLFFLYFEKNNK